MHPQARHSTGPFSSCPIPSHYLIATFGGMKAYQIRTYFPTHTQSVFTALDQQNNILLQCSILELPWRDNERKVSCFPEGIYRVVERRTDKFKRHYHILDVPERSFILQHPGNFTHQIEGCQLPGERFQHLNRDAVPDIINTRATLDKMLRLLGKEYTLYITSFSAPSFPHKVSPSKFWQDHYAKLIIPV